MRGGTVTAAARCLDDEDVARRKLGAVCASQSMNAAVALFDPLAAEGSIHAAGEAERADVAAG